MAGALATAATPTISPGQHGFYLLIIIMIIIIIIIIIIIAILIVIIIIIITIIISPDQQHLAPHDGEGARAQRRPRGQGLLLPPPQHLTKLTKINIYNN